MLRLEAVSTALVIIFFSLATSAQTNTPPTQDSRVADTQFLVRVNVQNKGQSYGLSFDGGNSTRIWHYGRDLKYRLDDTSRQTVAAAADRYLANPAPFFFGRNVGGENWTTVTVRVGGKIRVSLVAPRQAIPHEIMELLASLKTALATASDPTGVRNDLFEEFDRFRDAAKFSGTQPRNPNSRLSIPNDEPRKLMQLLAEHKAPGIGESVWLRCINTLATLDGEALGEQIYESYEITSPYNSETRNKLLEFSIIGGSTRAFAAYPDVLDAHLKSMNREPPDGPTFNEALIAQIHLILAESSEQILAQKIGQPVVDVTCAQRAWRWLVQHQNELTFDSHLHRFAIASH